MTGPAGYATDRLDGRCVVVTGAGSGIGLATALLAAWRGATVVASDVNGPGLAGLVETAESAGLRIDTVEADVSTADDVARMFDAARGTGVPLRGLVSCAGVVHDTPWDQMTLADWQRVVDINLTGSYLATHQATRLAPPEGLSMVLIASSTTMTPQANTAHYTASKAGLIGLGKSLAKELGGRSIRVNCVSPGPVDTPLFRGRLTDEEVTERVGRALLGRLGRPEDVAQTICFLLGDQSSWITGQNFFVNGGSAMA